MGSQSIFCQFQKKGSEDSSRIFKWGDFFRCPLYFKESIIWIHVGSFWDFNGVRLNLDFHKILRLTGSNKELIRAKRISWKSRGLIVVEATAF